MPETPLGQSRMSEDTRTADTSVADPLRSRPRASWMFGVWPKGEAGGDATPSIETVPAQPFSLADPNLVGFFRRLSGFIGVAVATIGVVVLVGWFKDFPRLTNIYAEWPAMKANPAAAMIVAGVALSLSTSSRRVALRLAQLGAVFLILLGSATLWEYASGRDLGIDQLLIAEAPGAVATRDPGRMPVLGAMNHVLCGSALLLLNRKTRRLAWLSSALALLVVFFTAIVILSYAFGAAELYTHAQLFLATPALGATAFILLGSGMIFARIDEGVLRWLASPLSGGVMLRRMLPLAILLPTAIAQLRLSSELAGLFTSDEFAAAIVAMMDVIAMSGALLWCAALLDGLDSERLGGESQIIRLNAELRRNLRQLEAANKGLEEANEELERFSYETSHVLGAPLRAMAGFSQIVLENYRDKLDDEGKRLLGVVRSSALQMGELIDGILEFLRFGRDVLCIGPIDMDEVVAAALKQLELKTRDRKLNLEISPLPTAFGDSPLIQQVWTNLLDNAVKFTAGKGEAVIQVSAVSGENETIYYVRDNGTGFDMQYVGKLFGVFQRLHGAEFLGNGIGLAIVKRIVARHGGRVWAEGKPAEGATFYFSLPRQESGHD